MTVESIDKYGHCSKCHKNMIVERVVDGKVVVMFTPEHDETEFLLRDGSKMRVCLCKACKNSLDLDEPKIQKDIMGCVINGWQLEVDTLVRDEKRPDWDSERGKKHMNRYKNLTINCHSSQLAPHVIEEKKRQILEIGIK